MGDTYEKLKWNLQVHGYASAQKAPSADRRDRIYLGGLRRFEDYDEVMTMEVACTMFA